MSGAPYFPRRADDEIVIYVNGWKVAEHERLAHGLSTKM